MRRLGPLRWAVCIIPPLAFIIFEETPELSGLDGINAAALIALSPAVVAIGSGLTALLFVLIGWLSRKLWAQSRFGFALLALAIVGALNLPLVEGDWRQWVVMELASIPAALLLIPKVEAVRPKSSTAERSRA